MTSLLGGVAQCALFLFSELVGCLVVVDNGGVSWELPYLLSG